MTQPTPALRCHDAEACALGQRARPSPAACGCAPTAASASISESEKEKAAQHYAVMAREARAAAKCDGNYGGPPAESLDALMLAVHLRQRAKLTSTGHIDALSQNAATVLAAQHERIEALQAAPPAPAAVAVPESHTQALEAIATWPVTDMLMNMDAANMRGLAQRALAAPAQEHATQLAGQGQALDRQAALQDSAYAAGMLTGWNLCIADDHATFSKVRGERMTGAARVAKAAAAAPAQAQEDAARLDAMQAQRIAVVPEFEGPWDATIYGDSDEPIISASGNTPREAIDAARAAQGGA